jgi:spermidine synthase
MNEDLKNKNTAGPLVHDENGELSLHFNFPTIQSRMLVSDPGRLVLDYTRTMMGFLLLQPKPERIAMIGLGGGSLAKYCRRYLNECDFTAVELSPDVIALRHTFGVPDDGDHFRVLCADGADFVRQEIAAFDVLLIDGFDCEGQPQQLCSAEFYDNCHGALRKGGILVANLCADDTGYGRYVARICAAFDDKVLVVEADEGENKIVFACKEGRFPPTFNELATRLRALESTHSVDLDTTAQKILRGARSAHSPRTKPRKRR